MRTSGPTPEIPAMTDIELWGGVECTVNRVRDFYLDQLKFSDHENRAEDLELFAELGIKKIRYPVLWERIAPRKGEYRWAWADERLERLRELGVEPILGLVHHGSGPSYTDLLDPSFAEGLAEFAARVAARYPWARLFTPVNEPLTTARFSALYGLWYPHASDSRSFARALLNQCRAISLSMRAIREVTPGAVLVQTEDVGKTYGTRLLQYQVDFENERRWLSYDLLTGMLDWNSPAVRYLLEDCGVAAAELAWFEENPCPPGILGVNYYVTSERFLDERLDRYPACTHGGNGRHLYADVEAVRVLEEPIGGHLMVLREAWQRYGLPMAITEAHIGCTREEQMRWLTEAWTAARQVSREGGDVRAVTAWSLLGAHDWNSLLTRADGFYEPGVFDIRGGMPRETALGGMMRALAAGMTPTSPALASEGWWRRGVRFEYPPVHVGAESHRLDNVMMPSSPLLITGATGTLGRAFARICDLRGLHYVLLSRAEMDIADEASVLQALSGIRPWAVINTAGYVRVDDAEREPEKCLRENTVGPATLAKCCEMAGIPLVTFSSDLVFGGERRLPYLEGAAVAPLNVYGQSKAQAEEQVLGISSRALVIRTSAFFGPWDEYNFVTNALRTLSGGGAFIAPHDSVVSPTYVPDLVNTTLDLMLDGEHGIWHLANPAEVSWAEFAMLVAEEAGLDRKAVEPCSLSDLDLAAARPPYSALGSARGQLMPSLDQALARYFDQLEVPCFAAPRSSTAAGRARTA